MFSLTHFSTTLKALAIFGCFGMTIVACEGQTPPKDKAQDEAEAREGTVPVSLVSGHTVRKIYWSDGDSGRIEGEPFRLADVDAPETGGVGARGGAKCETERALGFAAKAWVVEMTRPDRTADLANGEAKAGSGTGTVSITDTANVDRYGRQVLSLSVNGESLAELGVEAGHYGPWPHKAGRAISPKPDWCN